MKNNYICFVAGKSGGHLLPCITAAKKIVENNPATQILFFSTQTSLDKELLQKYSFIKENIYLPLSSLGRKGIFSYIRFALTFVSSFFISFKTLYNKRPSKIISMGGAVSLPVCLVGSLLKVPIELIELNVIPGKTIKTLAQFSDSISICFQETQKYFTQKCYITEYPLRFNKSALLPSTTARKQLGLDPHKKTIFVLGGSQGSLSINNYIKSWLQNSKSSFDSLQIIHQTGTNDYTDWKTFYKNLNITALVFSFYHEIHYCYSAADLIICRSGAGTLFEIAYFNKPCITIPLETISTNHQRENALAFKKQYGKNVTILFQKDLKENLDILVKTIQKNLNI